MPLILFIDRFLANKDMKKAFFYKHVQNIALLMLKQQINQFTKKIDLF